MLRSITMATMLRSITSGLLLNFVLIAPTVANLDVHYYEHTCPQVDDVVRETVQNATMYDPKVPARILRMFFHDCFIRGCDASILLDSSSKGKAEKDGPPNISVRAFYVIDDAKAKLESACPHTVSCADILAIAARDAVALPGGPFWNVLKGRKDGKISKASETTSLPAPFLNLTQLIGSFAQRGLGLKDLVALSGGHTLGFSHCSSFEARLRNFSLTSDIDPTMEENFANRLKKKCPLPNKDHASGEFLDSTSSKFDNDYYKELMAGRGVFGSDQALYSDQRSSWIVEAFAKDQITFFKEFVASMVKLGNIGIKSDQDGEVRVQCRQVNSP